MSPKIRRNQNLTGRGIPARVGSLVLLLQRSPLVKLLPEARVISTSGFTDPLQWTATIVAGLGAFDSIAGASEITQVQPSANSTDVNAVAGEPLTFWVQATGTPEIPAAFQIGGDIPPGLIQSGTENSRSEFLTGIPTTAGMYEVSVTAWQFPNYTGDFLEQTFTFIITNPPLPVLTSQPSGGNYSEGQFVSLLAAHDYGKTFTWKLNDEDIPPGETLHFPRTGSRKFRVAPTQDPGTAWFADAAFDDSSWSGVSGGIGYDSVTGSGENFLTHLAAGGNLQAEMSGTGKPVSVHLRMPFTLTDPAALSFFKLRVQCDDGFVAWLNGTEIASLNKPASLQWNSAATAQVSDATAVTFREFNIPQHLGLLRRGPNLLAIQAMNQSSSSTGHDFLFNCELAAGINSTNSPSLLLTGLIPEQAGNYTLTATNPAGSATSDPAPVFIKLDIVSHPEPVTIESGRTAQLNVTPGGSPPFSYQWYRGASGDTSAPVPGATEESLITPALTSSETYWVRVTSPGGVADSTAATVTVIPPALETFAIWAAAQFSAEALTNPAISGPGADPDGDGLNNTDEYVFGTLPLTSGVAPIPALTGPATSLAIQFTASRASGPGYGGRTRVYTVESASDLSQTPWTAVEAFTAITGNGQTVTVPLTNARFYRLRVQLVP